MSPDCLSTSGDVTCDSYNAGTHQCAISPNTNVYLYDAEGRICAVNTASGMMEYLYNAEGTRVAKGVITSWSCDTSSNGFTMTTSYILGPGNQQLAELAWSGGVAKPAHTNVWLGAQLAATYDNSDPDDEPSGILYFHLTDWLGTRRVLTDSVGNTAETCASLPYGNGETCIPTPTEHLFTGKERDAETNNDYFDARYYASSMGRFLSPDWSAKVEPVPYAKLDSPQSLNLYVYVGDNPLSGFDADGHQGGCNGGKDEGSGCEWVAQQKAGHDVPEAAAQQQTDSEPVGSTTVGSLEKTMSNEDRSLSTPKNGDPTELANGKTALANAIINNAELDNPAKVAPATGTPTGQDAQIMRDAYTNRANGGADPVQGRTQFGNSHNGNLKSRSASNGLKGKAGRETVFQKFGPFADSTSRRSTYIYIYNDPGH
jgi:RHS repeat-associated protein